MRNLARRLIAAEHQTRDSADTGGRTAFRVCEKLRVSLSALAGTRGFRTLLVRAVTRAKGEAPWLGKLEVGKDGTLLIPELLEEEAGRSEAAKGGEALV